MSMQKKRNNDRAARANYTCVWFLHFWEKDMQLKLQKKLNLAVQQPTFIFLQDL